MAIYWLQHDYRIGVTVGLNRRPKKRQKPGISYPGANSSLNATLNAIQGLRQATFGGLALLKPVMPRASLVAH